MEGFAWNSHKHFKCLLSSVSEAKIGVNFFSLSHFLLGCQVDSRGTVWWITVAPVPFGVVRSILHTEKTLGNVASVCQLRGSAWQQVPVSLGIHMASSVWMTSHLCLPHMICPVSNILPSLLGRAWIMGITCIAPALMSGTAPRIALP